MLMSSRTAVQRRLVGKTISCILVC